MDDAETPQFKYAEHLLTDAADRLRFQHEFSLAGFKTLVLINGGAIIALLTYVGNSANPAGAFVWTFGAYACGLALATLAYLFAYESQSEFMNFSNLHGLRALGFEAEGNAETASKRGTKFVGVARILSILSLVLFIAGSATAMYELAQRSIPQEAKSQPQSLPTPPRSPPAPPTPPPS